MTNYTPPDYTPPERLYKIISHLGIKSLAVLAKSIGYNREQVLYDIRDGKTKAISSKIANRITTAYPQFNLSWLLTGYGEMLINPEPEQSPVTVSETNTWDNYVTPILKEMSRLSEEVGRLKAELSAVQNKKVVPTEDNAEDAGVKQSS